MQKKAYLRLVHLMQNVPDFRIGNAALYQNARRPTVGHLALVSESEADQERSNIFYGGHINKQSPHWACKGRTYAEEMRPLKDSNVDQAE